MTGRRSRGGEALALQGSRAGFASRVLAAAMDLGLLWLAGLAFLLVAGAVRWVVLGPPFAVSNLPPDVVTPSSCAAAILYFSYFWGTTGRTPGQHVLGLRVVRRGGGRMRPLLALLRAVLYVAFPIGLLWVLVSRRNASVQDLVTRSAVVYDWAYRPVEQ